MFSISTHRRLPERKGSEPDLTDSLRWGAMARFRYVIADVFTDTPLQGNQVAVFTDSREIPEEQLQRLARETNFSETTFARGHAPRLPR
jgi:hypothetical protein